MTWPPLIEDCQLDLFELSHAQFELFQERAAIREYDGGMTRVEAEAGATWDVVSHGEKKHPRAHRGAGTMAQEIIRPDVWARGRHFEFGAKNDA